MLDTKTYIFDHFYEHYLVLLTMVPRNITTRYFILLLQGSPTETL